MPSSAMRAQHGEDALLAERFGGKRGGFYVEVGALDGEFLSNTYYFEKALDWRGVLVEANPEQAQLCRGHRPLSQVVASAAVAPGAPTTVTLQVAKGNEGYSTLSANRVYAEMLRERNIVTTSMAVPAATLDDILARAEVPAIDFVTIDVEGHERDVMRGFDVARWAPTVVLVESAGGAPDVVVAWRLLRAGYGRTRRVVINDWYEPAPPVRRTWLFVASYVRSAPDVARRVARDALRAAGLLDRVRARRARRG
jgi:FkbM family methyltransferase